MRCFINNRDLRNNRRDPVYQSLLIDLYLSGCVTKEIAEGLIGAAIPDGLNLPEELQKQLD